MNEIIDLISSVSVLIASLAGLTVISKWKKERFDKVKIEAFESYEDSIRVLCNKVEEVVHHNFDEIIEKARIADVLDQEQNSGTSVQIFINKKHREITKLEDKLLELNKLLRVYSGYAGGSMAFSYNYFNHVVVLMSCCLRRIIVNRYNYKEISEDDLKLYMIYFLVSESRDIDIIDYMCVQSVYNLLILGGESFLSTVDKRVDFNSKVLKIVAVEKMRLHSMFFGKAWLSIKLFLIKYSLVGRVIFASEKFAVIIGHDGVVQSFPMLGKDYKEMEKKYRNKVFLKLLKQEIKNIFI